MTTRLNGDAAAPGARRTWVARSWLVVRVVAPLVVASLLSVVIMAVELAAPLLHSERKDRWNTIYQTFLVGDARVAHLTDHLGERTLKFSSTKHQQFAFSSPAYDFNPDVKVNEQIVDLNDHAGLARVGSHVGMSGDLVQAFVREFQGTAHRVVLCVPKGLLIQWFAVSERFGIADLGSATADGPDVLLSGKLLFVSTADTCCMISLPQAFFAFLGYGFCLFPLTWIACSVCFKRFAGARPEGDAPEGVARQ
jgi:hypothetical protein